MDQSSSNSIYGGIYDLSITIDETKLSTTIMSFTYDDTCRISIDKWSVIEDENPVVEGLFHHDIKDPMKMVQFLRQVAHVLENRHKLEMKRINE